MKRNLKEEVIKQLKKTPVVEVVCKRAGVGRSTFYWWKKEDPKFADEVELAIQEGSQFINDMAESQLISAIKEGNMTGIIFWLKNHHRQYSPKLEVTTKDGDLPLTDEQKEIIRQSLNMAFNFNSERNNDEQNDIST